MRRSETAAVLAKIAAVDNRRLDNPNGPDTPILDSWHEAIGDLSFEDCKTAVAMHRRESTDWIQPAHIRANVKRIRKARIESTEMPTPNVDPDSFNAYNEETAAIRDAIADGTFDADRYGQGDVTLSGHPPFRALAGPEVTRQRALQAFTSGLLRRPERPHAGDYTDTPLRAIGAPQTVPKDDAKRMESERRRQLAAISAMVEADSGGEPGHD